MAVRGRAPNAEAKGVMLTIRLDERSERYAIGLHARETLGISVNEFALRAIRDAMKPSAKVDAVDGIPPDCELLQWHDPVDLMPEPGALVLLRVGEDVWPASWDGDHWLWASGMLEKSGMVGQWAAMPKGTVR